MHFCDELWQGCRFAPTPALPKDQALGLAVAGVSFAGLGLSVYLHAYMRTVLRDRP
ncbi:hypothetical protein GCWU000325_01561 [Alloprevotella tannerae ATCC 51259]|uniref:Uncharacterized protein n=1 Tax=Alloprevotella tannerae ATCC 51259 TaxID=626522 RepID=C9LH60_9BACT|nr:hypothetical protein GCWU000325_01561 [Alloprevotella tannerae ATCC 51259]